jgi:hypothetical protein
MCGVLGPITNFEKSNTDHGTEQGYTFVTLNFHV